MPTFDRELTDPAPNALKAAMLEAVRVGNERCRVGILVADGAAYDRFLTAEYANSPEGVAIWVAEKGRVSDVPPTPRATVLGVAWFTSPLGRRTVRVAGRRIEPFNENPSNRFGPPWRTWPPMCHIDPDNVVARTFTGGQPETIAMCRCGAFGAPDKLGWMRGRCGPCHDHLEEHGAPLSEGDGPFALRTPGQLMSVGWLPLGNAVAAIEWGGREVRDRIVVWDRRTGASRSEPGKPGTFSAGTIGEGLLLTNGYRVVWVPEVGEVVEITTPNYCVGTTFRGTTVTSISYNGAGSRRDLLAGDHWQPLWDDRRQSRDVIYFSVALQPRGSKVALGLTDATVELLDDETGVAASVLMPSDAIPERPRQRCFALAFSPDGKLIAAGAGRSGFVQDPREEWWGRLGGVYLYDTVKGQCLAEFSMPSDDILAVAFSPDGKLLFAGSTNCLIHVFDVKARKEVAQLGGHVGGVNALAFSPDGETLASAGGDGLVRLWPWRRLLEPPARPAKKKRA